MNEFWNARYKEEGFAYGVSPNEYFENIIKKIKASGNLLLPAEGEGRNAVFASKMGFKVDAFDLSVEGKNKALKLAEENEVNINYQVGALEDLHYKENSFDVIALIYAHFPMENRRNIHRKLITLLKPDGHLILEGFSKKHIAYQKVNDKVGGPKNVNILFSEKEIEDDFNEIEKIQVIEEEILLNEGLYHQGFASVIRYVGKK